MRILILGAKGNLGTELVKAFTTAGHETVGLDRNDLDVTDSSAVRARFIAEKPDAIINAVAWNDVDGAELPEKRPSAFLLNETAPRVMAETAKEVDATFVHFSTDYVFEGTSKDGYNEDSETHPISAYGESKAAGERAVLNVGGRAYLIRTSKIFGPAGTSSAAKPSFVSIMLNLAKTKPSLSIVDEEVGCPTYTKDIAEATVHLLTENFEPGIYHFVNEGPGVTWYGFAQEFFGILGVTTPITPVTAAHFLKPANRPKFAALNNTKFPALRPRLEALKAFFQDHPECL